MPDAQKIVPILLPMPSERAYSYTVPSGMEPLAVPGAAARVPLGPRQVVGLIWDSQADRIDPAKLRPLTGIFDCPPIDAAMRRFIEWVAAYTLSPPGLIARMVLRAPAALDPQPFQEAIRLTSTMPERLTPARRKVLELAADGSPWTRSGLAHAAGVTPSVINGLIAQNVFQRIALPPLPVVAAPDPDYAPPTLSAEQKEASDRLARRAEQGGAGPVLLDGVTGSGKTEVYFEAIAAALKAGRQVLILLPEIALTETFLERFEERFGAPPAQWHSDLPPRLREKTWRQVAEGTVKVVAGARSALFLPFNLLGLIIVDEEHDPAYKQEDGVFYHARDMAVIRGHLADLPVILASATPSLESRVNAEKGRYERLVLPQRFSGTSLPKLSSIDMRRHPPERGGFLSPVLISAVGATLGRGEQALLFLNRRGYAPLTLCRVCGHRFQCPNCSTWLVEHRFRSQLKCHHCGHQEKSPEACPECGTLDHLVACGPGVERIAEEAERHFPEARILVLSSDMAGGPKRLRLELESVARGEADLIIGTQLVAKGHNFSNMTLVGVVDADIGLAHGDPRAAERTFQLITQVTGRAGRSKKTGIGMIQTYQPDHPVMRSIVSGDAESFYQSQIEERRRSGMPPFGRLASIIVSAANRPEAENHARALRQAAPSGGGIALLGPAEAPLALIRGRYRFRLLAHAPRNADMQTFIRTTLRKAPRARGSTRVQIDIDPQSFL